MNWREGAAKLAVMTSRLTVPHMGRILAWRVGATMALVALAVRAQSAENAIPAGELAVPPEKARIQAVAAAARVDGWSAEAPILTRAAFDAYRTGNLQAARGWLAVARWAGILGEHETVAVPAWIRALESAGLAHANLPRTYTIRKGVALSARLSPSAQVALAEDPLFLDAFFGQLSPYDYLPKVLAILGRLHDADPATFAAYHSLAIAIALVYDTPPPPYWPHAQIGAAMPVRALPDPLAAFRFFVEQDRAGRCYQPLRQLGPEELKFVVDVAASFEELRWSQTIVDVPLDRFDQVYSMIRYRVDRLRNGNAVWPGPHYTLPLILGAGGICVDQAYFACEAGKARGVPTLLFMGAGLDGRHAWFGYLDQHRQWRLDAGRYAEQRLVTGAAIDPQTWGWLTDHDLRFLSERFQHLETTRRSRIHSDFARAFLQAGDLVLANQAAEDAIRAESRNLEAWELLLAVSRRRGDTPTATETILRRALLAFRHYPDLEARFTDALVASLRSRGETSMADFEQAEFIRTYGGRRGDLAIREAAQRLALGFGRFDLASQIGAYNRIIDRYAGEGGAVLFDSVVRVFVEHLIQLGQPQAALKALDRARTAMKIETDSPLGKDFDALAKRIRSAP